MEKNENVISKHGKKQDLQVSTIRIRLSEYTFSKLCCLAGHTVGGRGRGSEFKVSLVYTVSSRTARDT